MKQFKLYFFALLALLCTVSFSANAIINVGDTITMDGVIFKVPASATNLITNPGFEAGMTGDWRSGIGDTLLPANFAVKDSGGVNNSKYLISKVNGGSNNVASLRTLWPLQLGKGYLLSYYCKYQDTSKVTALEQYLKVSQTNTAGTETLVQIANSSVGGKNVWALNQTAFTGKYNFAQIHFRWLSTTYGFDEFALIKLDSIGLDVSAITAAIANAQTYVASNYPGVGALNAAIAAAEAGKLTLTGPASITAIVNNLAAAVRAYRLTQTVAPGDSLNFTFAIVNPGIDGGNVQPNGWTVTKNTGSFTNNNQHYSGVTNSYLDSWHGTQGFLQYVATQTITGLPKGTYRVSAAARATGTGVYVTGNDRQTSVTVNNDVGGTLGPNFKGWNLIKVDSVINVGNSVTIGVKTTPGWTGWWFSADDFTLTYFGEKVADFQKYMATVATSVRALDLTTVPNGVDALITAALAKSDTASTVASVLAVTNQLVTARDSANLSVVPYANLKAMIASTATLDTTYAGLTTFRAAITAANTLVNSATAMRPEILAGIKTLNTAILAYQFSKPASATSPADYTFAIANNSFELGNLNSWTISTGASDVGAKLNSNATYTMAGADGAYVFNIWGGTTLPFVVKQEITGLPKGTYKLIATVASDSLNVIKLFANGASKNILPNNKGMGKTDTLGVVTVADGKLTIGAQSQTWFKADNFRLLYYPPIDYTASIVNPGITGTSNTAAITGWTVTKNTGNVSGTGQHYSGVTTNRYLDSYNGTVGFLIYNAQQTIKNIPNGVYSMVAVGRSSGTKAYMFGNDTQTEIINNGNAGGALGSGWNKISVDKIVVMDSTVTIGVKTVPGWTGQWFSADEFTLSYNGPGDYSYYKATVDSLIAKAKRFNLSTSPDALDALLGAAITTAEATTDENSALSSYAGLKKALDANTASVANFAKLTALVTSSTTLSTTTNYNATALTAFQAAIATADGVVKSATTMPVDVDAALVALNKAIYDYKASQPAPADFTFVLANPGFEEGTTPGIDPTSIKKNGGFNTPIGWNVWAKIDTLAPGANFVGISSSTTMAEGTRGYETWVQGGFSKSINLSQKVVAPATGYYTLTGKLRCDGSSPSLSDPLKYDAQVYAKVGSAAEVKSMKLAEAPGLITGSGWNTKAAWRTLTVFFKANAGDTVKLGAASTSFMQLDNFTLDFKGNNNPATLDVAYITKVKPMDAAADSIKDDPIYRMLSRDPKLNVVLVPLTNVAVTATFDQSPYDALVIQETIGGGDAIFFPAGALGLSKLTVPTLYNKTYAFKAGRALVAPAAGTASGGEGIFGSYSMKIDSINRLNPLFKGITFTADTVQLFTKGAQDAGSAPTATLSTNKALNLANNVTGTEGTRLAYPNGLPTTQIFLNNVVAPDTLGGQPINTRMILFGMNSGALLRDHGKNITNANYTLWRNAVYSLVGLTIPETGVSLPAVVNVKSMNDNAFGLLNVDSTSVGDSVKIGGYNLSGDIKLMLSGAGASMYTLSYDTLAAVAGAVKDSILIIKYKPTAAGVHNAKLTISTLNFPDYVLSLSGSAKKDVTSWIVNPGIDAASGSVQPNGWVVTKGTGNSITNAGQHYSGVTTNRYLDSWNGTAGSMIYTATQVVKSIPNGIYDMSAAARTSGLKSYIFANDKQTEILNNGGAGGTLGNGFSTINVEKVVVLDSTISIGAKTVTGWTGTWFSADDFKMTYYGPGEFADYKTTLDSLVAKARRFDLNTSPNGLDGALTASINTAVAANDVATVMSSYKGLKSALDKNVASVPTYTQLTALIASSTVISNTTNFNGLAALKTAITVAETVANGPTTMPLHVDTAIVNLNKALYAYRITQPAPADFTFIMANPSFEEGTVVGIDPASIKKNGGFNTPKGWNVYAVIDTLAPGANFVNISGASMADGNNGYETWVQGGFNKSINVSQKIVAPGAGYYYLTAKARCDASSGSMTDPLKWDAHLYAEVPNKPQFNSKKLAEMPGLITGSGWNTKAAWRTLTLAFTANAGDTIKLGLASTSFMQMDNFTLSYRGNNNPATIDVAYITKVKPMDALADSVQNDPVYRMLKQDTLLTVTLKAITDVSAAATFDQSSYDALIIQESVGGGDAILFPANALGLPKLVVPTLYNKTYAFKAGRALVAPAAGTATGAEATAGIFALKVDSINKTNPLFRGITFVADTVQMFTKAAQDNGAAPTTVANSKALNVANNVLGIEGTLLAYPTGMTTTLCMNDIPAGDTIGGQITKARIITFGLNFGAMSRDHGQNMTNANYTLWRNAVYSLVGLTIPNTPMNVVTALDKPAEANGLSVVVYPNPTTSNINIANLNLNSTVKIFNMTGQQVFNGKANADVMTVDMSRYSNGIYMLQVVSNGKTMKSKIIKK